VTRRSEARRTLGLASLNHAFHDRFTDMIYVLLPVWQTEFARCSLAHFRTDSAGLVEDPEWIRMVAPEASQQHFPRSVAKTQCRMASQLEKELHLQTGNRFFNSFEMELSRALRLRIVTYMLVAVREGATMADHKDHSATG